MTDALAKLDEDLVSETVGLRIARNTEAPVAEFCFGVSVPMLLLHAEPNLSLNRDLDFQIDLTPVARRIAD